MLKQPATISIAPSRLCWWASLLLAMAVLFLVAAYGTPWLVLTATLILGSILWRERNRHAGWQLRWVPGTGGGWQAREASTGDWQNMVLHCDYLGPWLIGLRVGKQRHWLWPDSASQSARRSLRRLLLWAPPGS
nr:hypothetical protein [uncultured Halomonas sp.]